MKPARHPQIFGTFTRTGEEIKAARGKTSSRDFEKTAQLCERSARISALQVASSNRRIEEVAQEAARLIAERPEQRAQIEAVADNLKRDFESIRERRVSELLLWEGNAQKNRDFAEQARAFEARFSFNPYVDPFLDSVEQMQREQEAEKRKSGPKSKARARR